ncbi:winged helix-turn-helix transcriptional regulator [Micromonospora sp. WMMD736]|uniref:winged helix-turn-helix transcriptional regulator n=1 Tax=Micromonospora sp. WMMD736 TaxID=3404112 RepID=UPI003B96493B
MTVPRPGQPVRGSSTGRPLMAALDLFGRRWNLRLVWELQHGPLGFRALQQRCDNMSSSVLRQRLTELLDARLVAQQPDTAYTLTDLGRGAYQALRPLVRWSHAWASALSEDAEVPVVREDRSRPLH